MAVGQNSGAGRIAGEIERGAGERNNAVACVVQLRRREDAGFPVTGVADNRKSIDAPQVVAVLVPGRKAPEEGTAWHHFSRLSAAGQKVRIIRCEERAKIRRTDFDEFPHARIEHGSQRAVHLKPRQVRPNDKATHAVADQIDLGNKSAARVLDHVEELAKRHAQLLDGAAVYGLLDAIIEKVNSRGANCETRLPNVAAEPVGAIGQVLDGKTEGNCHPLSKTTGVVLPVGTVAKASTVMFAVAVRSWPESSTADSVTEYSPAGIVSEAARLTSLPNVSGATAKPFPGDPLMVTACVFAVLSNSRVSSSASIGVLSPG